VHSQDANCVASDVPVCYVTSVSGVKSSAGGDGLVVVVEAEGGGDLEDEAGVDLVFVNLMGQMRDATSS